MTLQLRGVSVIDKRLSTKDWWTTLWHCVGTILSNVNKMKEMIVDLKMTKNKLYSASIMERSGGGGKHTEDATLIYKKGQSRLYFLRKLCVCRKM